MTNIDQTVVARPKHGMLKAVDDSVSKGSDGAFLAFMQQTATPETGDSLPVPSDESSNFDEGSDAVAAALATVPADDTAVAGRFDPSSQFTGESVLLMAQGAEVIGLGGTNETGGVNQPDDAAVEALLETSLDVQATSAGLLRGDAAPARFAAAAVLDPLGPALPMTYDAAAIPAFHAEAHPDLVTAQKSADPILAKLALSEKIAATDSIRDTPLQQQAVALSSAPLQASSDLPSLPLRGAIAFETQVASFIAQTRAVSVMSGSPIFTDGAGAGVTQAPHFYPEVELLSQNAAPAKSDVTVSLGLGPLARFNDLSLDVEKVTAVSGHAPAASGSGILPSLTTVTGNIPPSPLPMPAIIAHIREHSATGKPSVMEVTLSPEDLGKIRLHITPDGDKLRIVLQVERPETLELLRRNTEGFAMELRQAGFAGTSFSFGNWSDGRDQSRTANRAAGPDKDEGPATFVTLTPPAYQAPARGGLDLRV